MAGVSTVEAGHGKKSVDQEIPLIPFIDLLFCCVMFLLATAVWNQLAHIDSHQETHGRADVPVLPVPLTRLSLALHMTTEGFTLSSSDGSSSEVPKTGARYDLATLRAQLAEWRSLDANRRDIVVTPDDGIPYTEVVRTLDVVVGAGFDEFSIDAAP